MIFKQDKDFNWTDFDTGNGYSRQLPVMTETGVALNRVHEPSVNEVVYIYNEDTKTIRPVIIKSGQYTVNNRISNAWTYQEVLDDLSLGKTISDYGSFYETPIKFDVNISIKGCG